MLCPELMSGNILAPARLSSLAARCLKWFAALDTKGMQMHPSNGHCGLQVYSMEGFTTIENDCQSETYNVMVKAALNGVRLAEIGKNVTYCLFSGTLLQFLVSCSCTFINRSPIWIRRSTSWN